MAADSPRRIGKLRAGAIKQLYILKPVVKLVNLTHQHIIDINRELSGGTCKTVLKKAAKKSDLCLPPNHLKRKLKWEPTSKMSCGKKTIRIMNKEDVLKNSLSVIPSSESSSMEIPSCGVDAGSDSSLGEDINARDTSVASSVLQASGASFNPEHSNSVTASIPACSPTQAGGRTIVRGIDRLKVNNELVNNSTGALISAGNKRSKRQSSKMRKRQRMIDLFGSSDELSPKKLSSDEGAARDRAVGLMRNATKIMSNLNHSFSKTTAQSSTIGDTDTLNQIKSKFVTGDEENNLPISRIPENQLSHTTLSVTVPQNGISAEQTFTLMTSQRGQNTVTTVNINVNTTLDTNSVSAKQTDSTPVSIISEPKDEKRSVKQEERPTPLKCEYDIIATSLLEEDFSVGGNGYEDLSTDKDIEPEYLSLSFSVGSPHPLELDQFVSEDSYLLSRCKTPPLRSNVSTGDSLPQQAEPISNEENAAAVVVPEVIDIVSPCKSKTPAVSTSSHRSVIVPDSPIVAGEAARVGGIKVKDLKSMQFTETTFDRSSFEQRDLKGLASYILDTGNMFIYLRIERWKLSTRYNIHDAFFDSDFNKRYRHFVAYMARNRSKFDEFRTNLLRRHPERQLLESLDSLINDYHSRHILPFTIELTRMMYILSCGHFADVRTLEFFFSCVYLYKDASTDAIKYAIKSDPLQRLVSQWPRHRAGDATESGGELKKYTSVQEDEFPESIPYFDVRTYLHTRPPANTSLSTGLAAVSKAQQQSCQASSQCAVPPPSYLTSKSTYGQPLEGILNMNNRLLEKSTISVHTNPYRVLKDGNTTKAIGKPSFSQRTETQASNMFHGVTLSISTATPSSSYTSPPVATVLTPAISCASAPSLISSTPFVGPFVQGSTPGTYVALSSLPSSERPTNPGLGSSVTSPPTQSSREHNMRIIGPGASTSVRPAAGHFGIFNSAVSPSLAVLLGSGGTVTSTAQSDVVPPSPSVLYIPQWPVNVILPGMETTTTSASLTDTIPKARPTSQSFDVRSLLTSNTFKSSSLLDHCASLSVPSTSSLAGTPTWPSPSLQQRQPIRHSSSRTQPPEYKSVVTFSRIEPQSSVVEPINQQGDKWTANRQPPASEQVTNPQPSSGSVLSSNDPAPRPLLETSVMASVALPPGPLSQALNDKENVLTREDVLPRIPSGVVPQLCDPIDDDVSLVKKENELLPVSTYNVSRFPLIASTRHARAKANEERERKKEIRAKSELGSISSYAVVSDNQ